MKDGYPGNDEDLGYCISVLHGSNCPASHGLGYSCMAGPTFWKSRANVAAQQQVDAELCNWVIQSGSGEIWASSRFTSLFWLATGK
jgi:hypothetical protein